MLDNQDHRGEQRIFVITGERIRDLWQAKVDAMKAAFARIQAWAAAPDLSEDNRSGYKRVLEGLEGDIASETFAIGFLSTVSIRMSAREIDRVYEMTRNPPIVDKTEAELLEVFGAAAKQADSMMKSFRAFQADQTAKVPHDFNQARDSQQEQNVTSGPFAGMPTPLT